MPYTLWVIPLLFYAPHLLGLRTFPDGDFTHHFLPFSLFQQQSLLSRNLPLWNPYTYAGHPFLADVQAAVFYPISNLLILVGAPFTRLSSEAGHRLYFLQLEAVIHTALAAYFTYLLLRQFLHPANHNDFVLSEHTYIGSWMGGCAFALSGYLTGYPPLQLAVLRTAIWLPLILLLLYRAVWSPTQWRWWIAAALAYAISFLAGHPQTFLHLSYVIAAWMVFLLVLLVRLDRSRLSWAHCGGLFAFAALGTGVCAAQLLPSLEFTNLSVRADVTYEYVSGGFPFQDSWQLLLPGVLTYFSPLYIGVVGVGFALNSLGLFGAKNRDRSDSLKEITSQSYPVSLHYFVLFFGLITIIGLLLSFGRNGFLYPFFYRFMPGWHLFRGQERAAYLVAFGLSILAGLGAAGVASMPLGRRRRLAAIFALIMIAGVYAFGLLWQLSGQTVVSHWLYLGIASVTLVLAMAMALLLWLPGWHIRRSLLLMLFLLINLFWANFTTNISTFGPARKTILAPEMEALQSTVHGSREKNAQKLAGRVYNEYRIYEDYGMRLKIEDVWGSSPLRIDSYAALFDEFPLDRMWQLSGVQHVLTWRRDLFVASERLAEFPQKEDATFLHRLSVPNARAWIVSQIRIVDEASALRLLADHDFDLKQAAILTDREEVTFVDASMSIAQAAQSQTSDQNEISLAQSAPGQFQVTVESTHGGLLVLTENWMPGWRVRNSACSTEGGCTAAQTPFSELGLLSPLRVNLTFIGLVIPPGTTHFELVYKPDSVRRGLFISGLTLLFLTLFCLGRLWWKWQTIQ
ncbi:hypothetical protein KFU94_63960 [Chloroflexi bacterium TSY]|nr:hypothetical protein [Chloroflexi bacterium TSY]